MLRECQVVAHKATVVVALLLVVAAIPLGGVAGAATATVDTAPRDVRFVTVAGSADNVTFVAADGTRHAIDATAEYVGAARDLDDDGYLEAPYVTSNGDVYAADRRGDRTQLASGARTSNTKLTTADWDDDGAVEVVYATGGDELVHVEYGGADRTTVANVSAVAAVGVADLTGDGERELVYVGTSGGLRYKNASGVTKFYSSGIGSNNGLGVGAPADVDGDGTPRVPIVDGSNNAVLVSPSGYETVVSGGVEKAPIAATNWTTAAGPELLYLDSSTGELRYTDANGTTGVVRDGGGENFVPRPSAGVATAADNPLVVQSVDAAANENVTVSVTTDDPLAALDVRVTGPANASLALDDFAENGGGPYTYTATVSGPDGDYEATFDRATAETGGRVTDNRSANATLDAVDPLVANATLADATDGDGVVNGTDAVRVTANVSGDVAGVTANASAFGAGTVSLASTGNGAYAATVDVDAANASDGSRDVVVTARDGQGNADSATTGAVVLDTQAPVVDAGENLTVTVGESVTFAPADVSDDTELVAHRWTFPNATRDGAVVYYTFDDPGTYPVSLAVTDAAGNVGTDTRTVTVEADSTGGGGGTGGGGTGGGGGGTGGTGGGGSDTTTTTQSTSSTTSTTQSTTSSTAQSTSSTTSTTQSTSTATTSSTAQSTRADVTAAGETGVRAYWLVPLLAAGFGVVVWVAEREE